MIVDIATMDKDLEFCKKVLIDEHKKKPHVDFALAINSLDLTIGALLHKKSSDAKREKKKEEGCLN